MAPTYESCKDNIKDKVSPLDKLGFTVHPEKLCLVPTKILVYLGFILNSILMTVILTGEKIAKVQGHCQ